ncbi:MAG: efflux RND transporter permease subunit, partial [Kiloniellales bacterium]|nr:efflux RND transporter permease subunit [Kiloniellales bacterium]
MSLAQIAIEKKAVTYLTALFLVVGSAMAYLKLGQLEDPEFTIKTAVITTFYPGASPEEVEQEVTDRIELKIQELQQVDYIESTSMAGVSRIKVEIKPSFTSKQIPQIWDELRRKVDDVVPDLPPGVSIPNVNDAFGDVFGHLLALTGEGFSYAEMEEYAKDIQREVSLVEGVARVDLWGVQKKAIYLDVSATQLSLLGLSEDSIEQTLISQNTVVDAGRADVQNRRIRIVPTGEFTSPEDISDLAIRPSLVDTLQAGRQSAAAVDANELLRIRDIGAIVEGYADPPTTLMRFNGEPAIGIAIANLPGVNVVTMGRAVSDKVEDLIADLPIGIELHRVHWQSDVIDLSVQGFFISLMQAVAIVLAVLALSMGWRMGVVIGTALILTIFATFIVMKLAAIDLQRMSLGALVIALGMMVDNAIVVADGVVVRMQKGMDKFKAAIEAASQPSMPLLGATVIAVMAFYPIFASEESAGEYCATLFSVVGISLMLSWLISVTLTPLQCTLMLKPPKDGEGADPYGGRLYKVFGGVLESLIRIRYLTIAVMIGLLVVSGIAFNGVPKLFFPDSSMPKFMIDYWSPEGNRIQDVAADLERIEERLMADERVDSVSAFIGAGPPRFYLPVEPESANPAYAQLVVNVHD